MATLTMLLRPTLLLILVLVSATRGEEGFTPLFNGKSLAGWEGDTKTFRVESGAIEAGSLEEKIARNEFLCTDKEYGDFELRLQARLQGAGQNAGIQFRSQRVPNHHEMIGYQCDMGTMGQRPIWGWLYDESRRRKFLAEADDQQLSAALRPDDFNDLVIRCTGPRIQIWVNGVPTVDFTETDTTIPQRGKIGLQIHGGLPAMAQYKNIRIRELAP
jgi:hypothetical protein